MFWYFFSYCVYKRWTNFLVGIQLKGAKIKTSMFKICFQITLYDKKKSPIQKLIRQILYNFLFFRLLHLYQRYYLSKWWSFGIVVKRWRGMFILIIIISKWPFHSIYHKFFEKIGYGKLINLTHTCRILSFVFVFWQKLKWLPFAQSWSLREL